LTDGDEPETDTPDTGDTPPEDGDGPGLAKARPAPEPPLPPPSAEPLSNVAGESDSRGPTYRVKLPAFEGPLDLLLHLIQKHELDILDIPIGFVTEKYVEYILLMEQVNIDIASEYLVMAATLAHIKSKMLLPTPPADQDQESEEEEDPRAELVRRLLEYQKYKLAGEQLGGRSVLGRDVFTRGTGEAADDGPAPLAPTSLFKLLEAFESILKRVHQTQEHHIDFERISITERISQLSDILKAKPQVAFEELFVGVMTRADLIITFLALLEMTRLRLTRIAQESPYAQIYIELSVRDDAPEAELAQPTEP
jgi:segregation and condensation protein A